MIVDINMEDNKDKKITKNSKNTKKTKKIIVKKKDYKNINNNSNSNNNIINDKGYLNESYEHFLKYYGRQISRDFHKHIAEPKIKDQGYVRENYDDYDIYNDSSNNTRNIDKDFIMPSLINDFCKKYKIRITEYLSDLDRKLLKMFYNSVYRKAIDSSPTAAYSVEYYITSPNMSTADKAIINCTEVARLFKIMTKLTGNSTYEQQHWHWNQISKSIKNKHRNDKEFINNNNNINNEEESYIGIEQQEHINAIINLMDVEYIEDNDEYI